MSKKKKCNFFLLFLGITLIFFINPVSAQFINPTFENGISGWDIINNVGWSSVNKAASLQLEYDNVSYSTSIYQSVNMDFFNNLTFNYGVEYSESILKLYIDDDLIDSYTSTGPRSLYVEKIIDISGYTGTHQVKFTNTYNTYHRNAYLYDCYLTGYSSVNLINYNPDIPITDTKPFDLSYKLNATYANNPLYPCFIYSWTGTDIGNDTHPNIIWQYRYEGYVNQASGSFTTSDYFHSYSWPDLNISYGIVLYNPNGMTPGIRFDNIESDPNMLDYDQIYVHYNYTYPAPTPQPTPNATPTATPTGTPTPGPTATAQPDPEPNNESLNTSFTGGYYGFVNDTVDGFFIPVYNFTDYIAQPLTMLNQTLDNFTVEMNKSFHNASGSLGISTNILFLIMVGFPQKLINVMTYYLAWVIILLIFKGDT